MISLDKIDLSYFTALSGTRLIVVAVLTILIITALLISIYSVSTNTLKGIINNSKEISVKKSDNFLAPIFG